MNDDALDEALAMAERLPAFVASADGEGRPHVACAGGMEAGPEGRVRITEWFCPGTLRNLERNRRVALVVWDARRDEGHQLIGCVEELEQTGVLDGYAPEGEPDVPQQRWRMTVRVEQVLAFSRAPHTDREE